GVDGWLAPVAAALSDSDEEEEAELEEHDRDEEKGSQEDVGELTVVNRVAQRRHECWRELSQSQGGKEGRLPGRGLETGCGSPCLGDHGSEIVQIACREKEN